MFDSEVDTGLAKTIDFINSILNESSEVIVDESDSEEMNKIAGYINATSLIVAEKAGKELENNIVYTRFNLYTLNSNTFVNCINNKFLFPQLKN